MDYLGQCKNKPETYKSMYAKYKYILMAQSAKVVNQIF